MPNDRLTLTFDGSYSRTIRKEIERNFRLRTDRNDINGDRTEVGDQRIPYIYELATGGFVPTITIDTRFDLNNNDLFWDDARLRRDESKRRKEIIDGRFDDAVDLDCFLPTISAGGTVTAPHSPPNDRRNQR